MSDFFWFTQGDILIATSLILGPVCKYYYDVYLSQIPGYNGLVQCGDEAVYKYKLEEDIYASRRCPTPS
jgi:hypothetical protein